MLFLLTNFPQKLKFGKARGILVTLFYASLFSSQLRSICQKSQKNCSSTSDWREYSKFCLKKNARTFSKNSTTHENITIPRLKKRLRNFYNKKNLKQEIKSIIKSLPDD